MEPTPRDEMDSLLDMLLPFAQQQLEKHGEFFPFAASIDSSGAQAMVAVDLGDEHPASKDVIDSLYEDLGAFRGKRRDSRRSHLRGCSDHAARIRRPDGRDPHLDRTRRWRSRRGVHAVREDTDASIPVRGPLRTGRDASHLRPLTLNLAWASVRE
jgi:hypothetical protein